MIEAGLSGFSRRREKAASVARPYFEASGDLIGTNCDWLITFGPPSGCVAVWSGRRQINVSKTRKKFLGKHWKILVAFCRSADSIGSFK